MAITGVTENEYKHYAAHGGTLRFEIEASDIDPSREFEKPPLIKPYPTSGFELKPSPIIETPANSTALFLYGGSWDMRNRAHLQKWRKNRLLQAS